MTKIFNLNTTIEETQLSFFSLILFFSSISFCSSSLLGRKIELRRAKPLMLNSIIEGIGWSSSATWGAAIVTHLATKLHMPIEVALL